MTHAIIRIGTLGLGFLGLGLLAAPIAPALAQTGLLSCQAELQGIRDQLAPLVRDIGDRAATCIARNEALSGRVASAEREAREAARRAEDAERGARERDHDLRQEHALLARAMLRHVAQRSPPIAAGCDDVEPPLFVRGRIELNGRVESLEPWRRRAGELEREIGLPLALNLREQSCHISIGRGWVVVSGGGGRPAFLMFGELGAQTVTRFPSLSDCPALGRLIADRATEPGGTPMLGFWIARPAAGGQAGEHDLMICRVPQLPGALGEVQNYQPRQRYGVISRE
jgi:hypothetical protein